MTNFYQIKTTAFSLKLTLKNISTKISWYISNIQKDQVKILWKHPNKNKHEVTILSSSNTPEITFILKKIKQTHSIIDISNKNINTMNPTNLTKT